MKIDLNYLNNYFSRLEKRGPFTEESLLIFKILLMIQNNSSITGNLLELGVENGTSALVLMDHLENKELITFIDIKFNDVFMNLLKANIQLDNYLLIEKSSLVLKPSDLDHQIRFSHIDGGHDRKHLINDFNLLADNMVDAGLIVLDDIFEIRWPDLTFAVLDILSERDDYAPFLLAGRKLYLCKTKWYEEYTKQIEMALKCNLQREAYKFWTGIDFAGTKVNVFKMFKSVH